MPTKTTYNQVTKIPTTKVTAMTLAVAGSSLAMWIANTYILELNGLPPVDELAQGFVITIVSGLVGYIKKEVV